MRQDDKGQGRDTAGAAHDERWQGQVGDGPFSLLFHDASELIGRKWTGAVVRSLFHGKSHFREIAKSIPGISDRLLSGRLKELAAHGIIERLEGNDGYRLTGKGPDLRIILIEIARWAHRWREDDDRSS